METRELAALSQIAEVLSDNNKSPLIPSEDIWKKIFCGAGLEDLFEERAPQFQIDSRYDGCLLYTSPSPRDRSLSRMPSSA